MSKQTATRELLIRAGVMPVVTVASVEQGLRIARALAAGGLSAIEITLRSAAALGAVRAIKAELPALAVGVGTVLNAAQVDRALEAGADFLVSPGTSPALAGVLADCPLPSIPGAATPSEIMALLELGFDCVKLFPAAALGGIARIKALAGPFPELALCPTGGIAEAEAAAYLAQPNVLCIGGSWMLQADWLAAERFDLIAASAAAAHALAASARRY
ncbi:MAG: bifunctional 4-hydroxy-2-oxoglutarate aldolase/2-dehydro-3-deoxy-phosphogluconate aldolase [Lysobacterales bacterium]